MTQQAPLQAPTTHDELAGAGLLALQDLVSKPDGDPARARAADAFEATFKFATEFGVHHQGNPAVQQMWIDWRRRAANTIRVDAAHRETPPLSRERLALAEQIRGDHFLNTPASLLPNARPYVTGEITDRGGPLGGEKAGTFKVKPSALRVPVELYDRKTLDYMALLTADSYLDGGRRWVNVSGGRVEIPDISDRRDAIRQWLVGQIPGSAGALTQDDPLVATMRFLGGHLAGVFGDERASDRLLEGFPSAIGRQSVPIPFADTPEDSVLRMQDPAYIRALFDMEEDLRKSGELGPRWYESVAGLATFAAEFEIGRKAAGPALKRLSVSPALIRKNPVLAKMLQTASAGAEAAGAGKTPRYIPIFQLSARSAMEFAAFEGYRAAITGNKPVYEGALEGAGMGLELAALNKLVAHPLAKVAGFLLKKAKIGGWVKTLEELVERGAESDFEKARLLPKARELAKRMPGERHDFVREVGAQLRSKYAAEYLMRMRDMAVVGSVLAGLEHAKAKSGKHWAQLLVQDPTTAGRLVAEGMVSEQAIGNVLGFWAGSVLTSAADRGGPWAALRGMDEATRATAERIVKDFGWEIAHPLNHERVAESAEIFGLLKRSHPDLFRFQKFAGLTERPHRPQEPPPGTGGGSPKPDFPGPTSPGGRTRERVEEMYSFWSPVYPDKAGGTITWRAQRGEAPTHWLQKGNRYAIARGRDGLYRILHGQGEDIGRRARSSKEYETLEAAVAQANALAQKKVQGEEPTIPQYKTPAADMPLVRMGEAATPEAEAAAKARLTAQVRVEEASLAVQRELARRKEIYERHRREPGKVGRSPEEVVELVERDRLRAREVKRLARDFGLRPFEVRALLSGVKQAPGQLGVKPISVEEARKMSDLGRRSRAATVLKAQRGARARAARAKLVLGAADYIRAAGGINTSAKEGRELWEAFSETGENYKRRPGFGRLVHPPKVDKGMNWETALERLRDAGYLPPRLRHETGRLVDVPDELGYEHLMEALEGNVAPIYKGQEFTTEQLRRMEAEGLSLKDRYIEFLENRPAGLPEGPAGSDSAGEMRRVDPQPVEIRMAQAGEAAAQARELLERGDALDPWEPPESSRSAIMLRRLAMGDKTLLGELRSKIEVDAGGDVESLIKSGVEAARAAQTYFQAAVLEHAGKVGRADHVQAYLRALDELAQGGHLTDPTRAELKKAGLLDEFGGLHESASKQMAMLAQSAMWDAQFDLPAESRGARSDITYLYAGLDPFTMFAPMLRGAAHSPLNPFRRPSIEGNEFIAAKLSRGVARTLERIGEGAGPKAVQWANRQLTMAVGRSWSAAGAPAFVKRMQESVLRQIKNPVARERVKWIFDTNLFLSKLRVDHKRLPRRVREDILRLIDARYFVDGRIKGPRDLGQQIGPQYGHLYHDVRRMLDVSNGMGQALVDLGFLTPEQFSKLRSAWVMRDWWRIDKPTVEEELARGAWSTWMYPGRDMGRATNPVVTTAIRNWDPDLVMHGGIGQEARIIESLRWLHGIANMDFGIALTAAELRSGRWSASDKKWVERVAVDVARIEEDARDPITGRRYSDGAKERGRLLRHWLDTMQTKEQWTANEPLREGQHPYTPQKMALIEALTPTDGSEGLYVARQTARELDEVMREAFYHPHTKGLLASMASNETMAYVGARLDEVSRFWRKARTIQQPTHWWRNVVGTVAGTNYQTGGVTPWDFARSILTGEGRYADSIRRMLWWEAWMKAGRPSDIEQLRKLDLLDAHQNGWLKQADELIATLGAGTFHKTLIDTGVVTDLLGAALPRSEIESYVRGSLEEAERELRHRGGFDDPIELDAATVKQLSDAISEMGKRVSGGVGRVDEAMVAAFESQDAAQRIRGIALWGAQYQTWELWMKYANVLEYLANNPQMTLEQAINRGAAGSGDYRNVSAGLKWWSTQGNLALDPVSQKFERYAGVKTLTRFMFASPFMLWGSTIRPTQFHAMLAHPMRSAVSLSIWSAMAAATMAAAGYTLDQMLEGLPGTPGFQGMRVLPSDELEKYAELFGNVPWSNGMNDQLSAADKQVLAQLVPRILANLPFQTYAPSTPGQPKLADFGQLATPLGEISHAVHDAKALAAMSNRERGEKIVRSLFGLGMESLSGALQTGFQALGGKEGETKPETYARLAEQTAKEWAGLFHPVTGLISPQAQRVVELQYADGLPIQDWLRGHTDPLARERDKARGLGALLFSATFGARRAAPYHELASDDEPNALAFMLDEIMPEWKRGRSSGQQQDALRIGRRVRDQVAILVKSTYGEYRSRPQGVSFNDLLKPQLDLHRDLELSENKQLRVRSKPETVLGRWIAGLPAEDQGVATQMAFDLLRSDALRAHAIPAVMNAAAARNIDESLLYRVYKAALTGNGPVLYAMERELRPDNPAEGNYENLPEWYGVFAKMPIPERGTKPFEAWERLFGLFRGVAGDDIELPQAPPLTTKPRRLQDLGTPDVIELLPERWARERMKQ